MAVNFSAVCKTTVSNILMVITVFKALELTHMALIYTPVAFLLLVILSALPELLDIREACSIWQANKMDFLVLELSSVCYSVSNGIQSRQKTRSLLIIHIVIHASYVSLMQLHQRTD